MNSEFVRWRGQALGNRFEDAHRLNIVLLVKLQHLPHHAHERRFRQMRLRTVVIAAAVSRVRPAFRILKERHPSQVELELKLIEIHAVHRLNPHADELLGQLGDLIILTDNLPVEIGARRSPFAPEDNEHRLARFSARSLPFLVVVQPCDFAVNRLRLRFVNGLR